MASVVLLSSDSLSRGSLSSDSLSSDSLSLPYALETMLVFRLIVKRLQILPGLVHSGLVLKCLNAVVPWDRVAESFRAVAVL